MADDDGPMIAKAVYHALFNQSVSLEALNQTPPWIKEELFGEFYKKLNIFNSESHPGYKETCTKLYLEYITARTERSGRTLALFSLAHVVDDITREMREKGIPAKRWATFVHIGV